MAGHRRQDGQLAHVPEPGLVEVGHVRQHAQTPHLGKEFPPAHFEAVVRAAHGGIAQLVFKIPRQRDHAHAHVRVQRAQLCKVALEQLAALHRDHGAGRVRRRFGHVARDDRHAEGPERLAHRPRAMEAAVFVLAGEHRQRLHAHAALLQRFRRHRTGAFPRDHAIQRVAMRVRNEHKLASGAYTSPAALAPRSSARIIRLSRARRKRVLGRKNITFFVKNASGDSLFGKGGKRGRIRKSHAAQAVRRVISDGEKPSYTWRLRKR